MRIMKIFLSLAVLGALSSCGSIAESGELNDSRSLNTSAYTSGLPAIQLINAKTMIGNGGGLSGSYKAYFAGDIEVENIAYSKSVKVVYSVDGGAWQEADASYVKSLGNNREHWKFSIIAKSMSQGGDPRGGYSGPKVSIQFALKYTVNGQVYWDNNGGAGIDYRIGTMEGSGTLSYGPAAFGKQNIVLTYATYSDYPNTYFRGTVALKKVNGTIGTASIVYTTDGWATVKTMSPSYQRASYAGQDVYYFADYSSYGDVKIDFALSYDLNGVSSWDNNVNSDYHIKAGVTAPY